MADETGAGCDGAGGDGAGEEVVRSTASSASEAPTRLGVAASEQDGHLFPDYMRSRPEFEGLAHMPLKELARVKAEAEAYLALEKGVDATRDSRYFQTPADVIERLEEEFAEEREREEAARALELEKARKDREVKRRTEAASNIRKIELERSRERQLKLRQKKTALRQQTKRGGKLFKQKTVRQGTSSSALVESSGPRASKSMRSSSDHIAKVFRKGEFLLSRTLLLRVASLGLRHPNTVEARNNLIKCLMAQRKSIEARQLREQPVRFIRQLQVKLAGQTDEERDTVSRTFEAEDDQEQQQLLRLLEQDLNSTNTMEPHERPPRSLAPLALESAERPKSAHDKFSRTFEPPRPQGPARNTVKLKTIYPKWTEFRAKAGVALKAPSSRLILRQDVAVSFEYTHNDDANKAHGPMDQIGLVRGAPEDVAVHKRPREEDLGLAAGRRHFEDVCFVDVDPGDIVALLPVPDGNHGSLTFPGSCVPATGTYSLFYFIHGSQYSISQGTVVRFEHAETRIRWSKECAEATFCGDTLFASYTSSLQGVALSNDFLGLFHFAEEEEEGEGEREEEEQHGRVLGEDAFSSSNIRNALVTVQMGPSHEGNIKLKSRLVDVLAPGMYILKAFFIRKGEQVVTGKSEPLAVRAKINIHKHDNFLFDRHLRVCIVQPPGEASHTRTATASTRKNRAVDRSLCDAISSKLGPFAKSKRIHLSIIDLFGVLSTEDLDAGDIEDVRGAVQVSEKKKRAKNRSRRLETVLWEIEACRPMLVFLYEDRYGWVCSKSIPPRVLALMPWLDALPKDSHPSQSMGVFEIALDFGLTHPWAQGDVHETETVTVWRKGPNRDPEAVGLMLDDDDTKVHADDQHEPCSQTNFDKILKLEEKLVANGGEELIQKMDSVEHVANQVYQRFTEWLDLLAGDDLDNIGRCLGPGDSLSFNFEVMAGAVRSKACRTPMWQEIEEKTLDFVLNLGNDLPFSKEDLVTLQLERSKNDSKNFSTGMGEEAILMYLETKSLHFRDLDPSWSVVDLYLPPRWTRGTPLAVVGSELSGKTTFVAEFVAKLKDSQPPWFYRDNTNPAASLTNRTTMCFGAMLPGNQRTLVMSFLLGGHCLVVRPENVVDRIVDECVLAFGQPLRTLMGEILATTATSAGSETRHLRARSPGSPQSVFKASAANSTFDARSKLKALLQALERVNGHLVVILDGVDDLEHKDRAPLEWLPSKIDPFVAKFILTMHPSSATCAEVQRRLFNFVLVPQLYPFDFLNNPEAFDEDRENFCRQHWQQTTAKMIRKFEGCFGNAISPAVRQAFHENPKWWCQSHEVVMVQQQQQQQRQQSSSEGTNGATTLEESSDASRRGRGAGISRKVHLGDESLGRLSLVLHGHNFGLLNDQDLGSLSKMSTLDLYVLTLRRLVNDYPVAGALVQVLVQSNRNFLEEDLVSQLERHLQSSQKSFDSIDWSFVRRVALSLFAYSCAGRLCLRSGFHRKAIQRVLGEMSLPKLQTQQQRSARQLQRITHLRTVSNNKHT